MRTISMFAALALVIASLSVDRAWADEGAKAAKPPPASTVAKSLIPTPNAVSKHEIDVGGQQINYTATAGMLPLTDGDGTPAAHVFYTAYEADAARGPRPVTFVFNGGPGAASAFLHIGALGPRAVPFNDKGSAALHPIRLEDNPDTWLLFTDLVFVDPVATGYSRAVVGQDEAQKKFFGVHKDAEAMSEVARLYLTRQGRLLDPVFVVGESYGGFRAILVAKRLLRAGFNVRGTVLISPVIEFSLIRGDAVTVLPIALSLPSIACAHAELKTRTIPAPARLKAVEVFARGRYVEHLVAGMREDSEINSALAEFTGLPIDRIAQHRGRVSVGDFTDTFRRSHDRALSLYDGSVSVALPRLARRYHSDPILDYAVSALTPAFVTYARNELGYATDLAYDLLNRRVSRQWDYGLTPQQQGYAGALDDLQEARTQLPSLRILVASGCTDLVTPYAVSQYLIDQMEPIAGAVPVEMKMYRGGHMMYLRAPSRNALATDAQRMYEEAMRLRSD